MSDDRQLSLLDWTPLPQPRTMIPFPRSRRVSEVKAIAHAIHGKKERAATKAWNDKIAQLRRQMTRAEIDADEIEWQIESFRAAVQSELDRMAWADHAQSRPGPGGAA